MEGRSLLSDIKPRNNDLFPQIVYRCIQKALTRTARINWQNVLNSLDERFRLPLRTYLCQHPIDARRDNHFLRGDGWQCRWFVSHDYLSGCSTRKTCHNAIEAGIRGSMFILLVCARRLSPNSLCDVQPWLSCAIPPAPAAGKRPPANPPTASQFALMAPRPYNRRELEQRRICRLNRITTDAAT